uniref:Uncharacterized protein n=1 Tax=Timema cristinae TaxID=61476 RepID=A0A7R9CBU8_TIMCR|nr:unnamed protein product [Timema cristinae]
MPLTIMLELACARVKNLTASLRIRLSRGGRPDMVRRTRFGTRGGAPRIKRRNRTEMIVSVSTEIGKNVSGIEKDGHHTEQEKPDLVIVFQRTDRAQKWSQLQHDAPGPTRRRTLLSPCDLIGIKNEQSCSVACLPATYETPAWQSNRVSENDVLGEGLISSHGTLCNDKSKCKDLEAKKEIELPKRSFRETARCKFCGNEWHSGDYKATVIPQRVPGKKMLKIIDKKKNGTRMLRKYEEKLLAKYEKERGNKLILFCKVCHKNTFIMMNIPDFSKFLVQADKKNIDNVEVKTKKKKKKKKKDHLCGLKQSAVSPLITGARLRKFNATSSISTALTISQNADSRIPKSVDKGRFNVDTNLVVPHCSISPCIFVPHLHRLRHPPFLLPGSLHSVL